MAIITGEENLGGGGEMALGVILAAISIISA